MTDYIHDSAYEAQDNEAGEVIGPEPYEKLTISNFFIFSKVMSNPEICTEFLRRAFPDLEIGKVIPVAESSHQISPGLKGVRFDVYASDGNHLFDLECQTVSRGNLPQRSRYYNCILDADQLDSGRDYSELKPVYIIFIYTFALGYGGKHKYAFRRYCMENRELALNDGTEIVFFSTKGTEQDIDVPMQRFLDYVDGCADPEQEDDEFIRKLDGFVRYARTRPDWRRQYMDLQMLIKEERAEAEARADRAEEEAARAKAETSRAKAETSRAKAETSRAKADLEKVIVGMIKSGVDGNTVMKIAGISRDELEKYRHM